MHGDKSRTRRGKKERREEPFLLPRRENKINESTAAEKQKREEERVEKKRLRREERGRKKAQKENKGRIVNFISILK